MARHYDELPSDPPEYDDDFVISDDDNAEADHLESSSHVFEEFDIEDPELTRTARGAASLLNRAKDSSKRLLSNFSHNILHPMTRMMDPVYELYRDSNIIFDSYLARVGNPLILKRLIYVFSITALIYIITASGIYPNKNELLFGDFYDPEKLNNFIETHINEKSMATTLEYLSSMPHIAGTAGDLTLAHYIEDTMRNNGLAGVEFSEMSSYINYPNYTSFTVFDLEGNTLREVDQLSEAAEKGKRHFLEYLAFNPDSAHGSAKGQVVYVNFGTVQDFQFLVDNKVPLKGNVLLMKYGGIPASQKLEIAEMYAAAAVLFISDPLSSDYTMDSIQKEGVGILKEAPGDVLTPGWASVPNAERLSWLESASTPNIVSLPIPWSELVPLLDAVKGKGVRNDRWDVTLAGTKHEIWTGASAIQVEVTNKPLERVQKPVWNVIGRISGREQYDKAIIIGLQRDSPCFGTVNPNTGTTVLLELVRLFAKMQSTYNWSPLRSIYFVSFDATNYNVAGSTEWVETNMRELKKEVYAYIDLSDAVSGEDLEVHSHPIFKQVLMSAMEQVVEPRTNQTLKEVQFDSRHLQIETFKDYDKNYLPFQSYLGIPSMELKFSGKKYPKNSCLDSYKYFQEHEIDKDMLTHRTLVELILKVVVKLVEEPLIPFDLLNYVSSLDHYLKDLKKYAESLDGYKGNELDSTSFIGSLLKLKTIGTEYEGWIKLWKEIVNSDNDQEPSLLTVNRWTWNLKLTLFEKRLLSPTGIPKRPWYRNVIYGPQYWQPDGLSSYEYATLPGVRDALRGRDWNLAKEQLNYAAELLAAAADSFIG